MAGGKEAQSTSPEKKGRSFLTQSSSKRKTTGMAGGPCFETIIIGWKFSTFQASRHPESVNHEDPDERWRSMPQHAPMQISP